MATQQTQHPVTSAKQVGFFSIFPILAKLAWRIGRRLFTVDTLVALEKKQGQGSGERTVEEEQLEQALQRNKYHFHFDDSSLNRNHIPARRDELAHPVLVVKARGNDERSS